MPRGKTENRLSLSATTITALECEPGKPFSEFFHEKLAGFGVRVMASGKKVYFVKCRAKGRTTESGTPLQVKHTLGTVTDKKDERGRSRPDAEQFDRMYAEARKIIDDAKNGITPADRDAEKAEARKAKEREQKLEEAKDVTLNDLLKRYLEAKQAKKKLKGDTAGQYRLSLETHCADWLDMPARDITKAMIEARHIEISKRKTVTVKAGEKIRGGNTRTRGGKGTADATMRTLRAVLNYGVAMDDIGALTANPVNVLKASGWFNLGRRDSSITSDQLKAWFTGIDAVTHPGIKLILQMSLFTGARKNEIASLKWSDVNLDAGTPYAVFRETKNGKQLLIPLPAYIVNLMETYKEKAFSGPEGFIFPSFGKSGHIKDPRKQIKKAIAAGGVEFMPHDSRRTFMSFCNQLKIPKWTIKRLCNHALPQDVTEGYVQHELKALQVIMEQIAAFILEHAGIDFTPPAKEPKPEEAGQEQEIAADTIIVDTGNVVRLDDRRKKRKAA